MADLEAQDVSDWDAVAKAITARLAETRMTQMEVASRAQVSLTTLRELQHNLNPRRRRPQTLATISEALGWPSGYLEQVLRGDHPQPHTDEPHDPVLRAIDSLGQEIRELRTRVEEIEQQLAGEDAPP
ncbi:MAG: helix-turn-helix domain-containing protein [Pseudonocardiaceae bacterium]